MGAFDAPWLATSKHIAMKTSIIALRSVGKALLFALALSVSSSTFSGCAGTAERHDYRAERRDDRQDYRDVRRDVRRDDRVERRNDRWY